MFQKGFSTEADYLWKEVDANAIEKLEKRMKVIPNFLSYNTEKLMDGNFIVAVMDNCDYAIIFILKKTIIS